MKKVLALVLAVVLVFGMSTVAFAASTPKLTLGSSGLEDLTWKHKWSTDNATKNGVAYANVTSPMNNVSKGIDGNATEIFADITALFTKDAGGAVTKTDLASDNITIGSKIVRGKEVVNKVERDGANARIVFNTNMTLTKSIDWEVELWVNQPKSNVRQDDTKVVLAGTYTWNPGTQELDADYDYFYIGDGQVIKATEYNREIELDLGHDFSIVTKLFDGKSYQAWVSEKFDAADIAVIEKYPEVENAYTVFQSGLTTTSNVVKLDMDDTFFVYTADGNGGLKYLGKSNTNLPLVNKYYLASKELKLAVAADVVDEAPVDTKNAPTGGDDVVVVNSNFNPGTGR